MARRTELASGVVALAAGLAALAYLLLAPTMTAETATAGPDGGVMVERRTERLLDGGAEPAVLLVLALALLLLLGVAVGAYLHARRGVPWGRGLLWACTAVLLLGTLLTGLSVGLPFVPAALAAFVASVAAAGGEGAPRRPSGEPG
ncbi:MAG TPA: hypothetical protein VIO14_06840 [Dehalococcoidia bacterium]